MSAAPSRLIAIRRFSVFSGLLDSIRGSTGPVNALFVDPRPVLENPRTSAELLNETGGTCISVTLPGQLAKQMHKGVLELGDMDEPETSWYFGKKGELMHYTLRGTVHTKSGYVSILPRELLGSWSSGQDTQLPSWQSFKQQLDAGQLKIPSRSTPFLFVGRMVDTAIAAVYELRENNEVVGVMISSEAAES